MYRILLAIGCVLTLAACANNQTMFGDLTSERVKALDAMQPRGDAFQTGLYKGYRHYARYEIQKEHNEESAELWRSKSAAAANGELPMPENPANWEQPAGKTEELAAARDRMIRAFNAGGTQRLPTHAAEAQASYDCWVEQQSENYQPKDIADCRADHELAMNRVEAELGEPYRMNFALGSARLDAQAQATIQRLAAAIRASQASQVVIVGHTDRVGSARTNDLLGQRRADAVARALINAGVNPQIVAIDSRGETQNVQRTADGVRSPPNRRVEVMLDYPPPPHTA